MAAGGDAITRADLDIVKAWDLLERAMVKLFQKDNKLDNGLGLRF